MSRVLTRQNPIVLWAIVALTGTLIAGCGSFRRRPPVAPPLQLSPAADRGQNVFMHHCHMCHPGGAGGLGPAINDKPLPDWLIRFQVRNGLGVMPHFPKSAISSSQLDDLIAYLNALRANPPPRQAVRLKP